MNARESYFSLQDISMAISPGETWALIGPNGAGKSTLLRLIAGIYWPTSGEVITRGRVTTLLDVTAGFNPELTGRENVYLHGSILGFNKTELSQLYLQIVEFAGIEEFMGTPVKYYSAGMTMRLGFSVSTAIQPDILLLDEALAVGDAMFLKRCLDRIQTFRDSGSTIVFATHDLKKIEELATHAVWLDQGRIRLRGQTEDVIAAYKASFHKPSDHHVYTHS
jgi:ABC-type polysaccharide/polyol phosphate transport system ATPase subunit